MLSDIPYDSTRVDTVSSHVDRVPPRGNRLARFLRRKDVVHVFFFQPGFVFESEWMEAMQYQTTGVVGVRCENRVRPGWRAAVFNERVYSVHVLYETDGCYSPTLDLVCHSDTDFLAKATHFTGGRYIP